MSTHASLRAVSDLHVGYPENRSLIKALQPGHPDDWLIVAGDVGELVGDITWALQILRERFARVVWVPGNHELWTHPADPVQLRGQNRYEHLVDMCRDLGVDTPEDPYPVWTGAGGPVQVAPLFLLYDYSFLTPGTSSVEESLAAAYDAGVVCSDEYLLHPDPYPSRAAWCAHRIALTERRLAAASKDLPMVLVSHWPLLREPTRIMTHPEFAQWCGTVATANWHLRFGATVAVYGHLHIPRSTVHDGVAFEEVSLGYPREWKRFGRRVDLGRRLLPRAPGDAGTTQGPT
jgi:3',5'-cyclic AMP phosphodiesterase CpdA